MRWEFSETRNKNIQKESIRSAKKTRNKYVVTTSENNANIFQIFLFVCVLYFEVQLAKKENEKSMSGMAKAVKIASFESAFSLSLAADKSRTTPKCRGVPLFPNWSDNCFKMIWQSEKKHFLAVAQIINMSPRPHEF